MPRFTDTQVTLTTAGKICTLDSIKGYTTPQAIWNLFGANNFTFAINTTAPNATVPVVSFTATNAAASVDMVIAPKGNGAISAHVSDGTSAGGNKRGGGAVDFQMVRSVASRVASGNRSFLAGGDNNTASGVDAAVVGGSINIASSGDAFVGGGTGNTSGGDRAAVLGGNANNASGASSGIIGASNAAASGSSSVVIGGTANTASNTYAVVLGGNNNTASGQKSAVIAGDICTADGVGSIASGKNSITRGISYAKVRAAGFFSQFGDAQVGEYILRTETGDGTQKELTINAAAGSASTRIVLSNDFAYKFRGQAIAREPATGDTKTWDISGTIKRGANAAATEIVGSVDVTVKDEDAGASAWALAIDADTTNGSLRVQATGEASHTIRWVVSIETVEVG